MKFLILITSFLLSIVLQAQSWRDTLELGKKLYAEQKYDQAYEKFVTAQRYAPEELNFNKEIGNSAYKKGDFETAEKAFQKEFMETENLEEKATQAHNLGNSQFKQKRYSEAIESYKQALRNDPNNSAARYNLAEAKRRLQKQKEEQQKQNQNQENQEQQKEDKQDSKKNKEGNKNEDKQQHEDSENENNQQNNNNGNKQEQKNADKLSSKKTERMLDELMKKEMKTKRKVQGSATGGKSEQVKSGKRW